MALNAFLPGAKYLGATGCLTDGCARYTRMIREPGFPVCASGTNPVDTKYRGKMFLMDVPGEITGVSVNNGDLVFGDPDGIVDVPKDLIGTTISRALDKVCTENTVRHELPDGATLSDGFACHRTL